MENDDRAAAEIEELMRKEYCCTPIIVPPCPCVTPEPPLSPIKKRRSRRSNRRRRRNANFWHKMKVFFLFYYVLTCFILLIFIK